MDTELSFLLNLLLNHKLQKNTKEAITARIKEVEYTLKPQPIGSPIVAQRLPKSPTEQAPSILAKYPDLAHPGLIDPIIGPSAQLAPVPIEAIAQTPETAKALAERQSLIAQSLSGKVEPGRTSPRKIGRQ